MDADAARSKADRLNRELRTLLVAGAQWWPQEKHLMFNAREIHHLLSVLIDFYQEQSWTLLDYNDWAAYVLDLPIEKPWSEWEIRFLVQQLTATTTITAEELAALFRTTAHRLRHAYPQEIR